MRKNRNSFFSEANMAYANYNPNMNMMAANAPYQTAAASNSFYSGPVPNNMVNGTTDLESRLAKMERQISRLEHRINKLEGANTFITEDFDSTTNNMYML